MIKVNKIIHRTPKIMIKKHPSIIWKTDQKVLFTFDDGPSDYSVKFAKLLNQHHLKGIFFIVGENYVSEIAKEVSELGHEIAWHSQSHRNFIKLSDNEIYSELSLRKKIEDDLNLPLLYFRFPFGFFWKKHVKMIESENLKTMMWTFKCDDYKNRSKEDLVKSFKQIKENDIVLLHDKSENVENTYEALKEYLEGNEC